MTDQTETARELLWRHQLPEDVIDGALCLHARELAARQRIEMAAPGRSYDASRWNRCVGMTADLIDPTKSDPVPSAVPAPATGRAEAVASCPGRELDPNPCRCPCYGCKHHCSAHNPDEVDDEPTTDRAGLREQIAKALAADDGHPWDTLCRDTQQHYLDNADAVLPLLPASVDRATVLREAADAIDRHTWDEGCDGVGCCADTPKEAAALLRRLAVEARDGHTTQGEAPCSDPIECSHEAALGQARIFPSMDEQLRAAVVVPGGAGEEPADGARVPRSDVGTEFVQQIDNPDEAALNLWETDLAQSGVDSPGCDCGHDGMGVRWHDTACAWKGGLVAEARQLLAKPDQPAAGPAGGAQQPEPVVTVHAAADLSPAAEEALGALVEVAKRQIIEEQ